MSKTSSLRIVMAASDLFRAHGYAGASMKDLAAKVGIQKASLYNYVSEKEDLVAQVLDLTFSEIFKDFTHDGDWRTSYATMVSKMASHLVEKKRCVALHLGYGVEDSNSEVAETVRRFFNECRKRFSDILVDGMPPEAAHDLATDTITLLEGATIWLATMGDDGPMKRAVCDLVARADAASAAAMESRVKSVLDEVVGDAAKATATEWALAQRLVEVERRATLRVRSA
jgi:TetR/AcrR family transcriptional regulator, transcriptional repressor for nem operon